jgi:hypothetical protein
MPNLANWVLACLAACIIATLLVKYGGDDDQCRLKADTLVVKMVWLWIDGTSVPSLTGLPKPPCRAFWVPASSSSRKAVMAKKAAVMLRARASLISSGESW